MAKTRGWLTVGGSVLIVLAIIAKEQEVAPPLPLILLCLGALGVLGGGISWAHTLGKPRLKSALLGLIGFSCGAASGVLVGEAIGPASGEGSLGRVILLMILGFWVGGTAFAGVGVWRGVRFHRRKADN
jgi:hypothetical protein